MSTSSAPSGGRNSRDVDSACPLLVRIAVEGDVESYAEMSPLGGAGLIERGGGRAKFSMRRIALS